MPNNSTDNFSETPLRSDSGDSAGEYPGPPWRLKGSALLRTQLLPIEPSRLLVPSKFKIVPALPGRTLGGILVARYGAGSSVEYSELIVSPALVRVGTRIGVWISHIYVDQARSVRGGHEIWGLPKRRADFRWHLAPAQPAASVQKRPAPAQEQVVISQADNVLCSFSGAAPERALRLPLYAPVWSIRETAAYWFRGIGAGRVSTGTSTIRVPASSPFSNLNFTGGRHLRVDDLDLMMASGQHLTD